MACRRVVHSAEAGDVVALAGVDLSIAPGETLALVGPDAKLLHTRGTSPNPR